MPFMLATQHDYSTERKDRMGLPSQQKTNPDTSRPQPKTQPQKNESQIRAERDAEAPERWDGLS